MILHSSQNNGQAFEYKNPPSGCLTCLSVHLPTDEYIMRNPRNINNQNEPTQPDQDRPKHRDAANYLETSTTLMLRQASQEDYEVKSPLSHLLLIS